MGVAIFKKMIPDFLNKYTVHVHNIQLYKMNIKSEDAKCLSTLYITVYATNCKHITKYEKNMLWILGAK